MIRTVLATSVVRGAGPGDTHGGLFRVDLDAGTSRRIWDWSEAIDFAGRGGDRGLRGMERIDGRLFLAASDEVFVVVDDVIVARHTCPALRHAHEMVLHDGLLFVTSTGFDSVLAMEPATGAFVWGLCVRGVGEDLSVTPFDPQRDPPHPQDTIHLNSVASHDGALFLSGRKSPCLLRLKGGDLDIVDVVPLGTHNVLPTADGLVFNDTASDRICVRSDGEERRVAVPRYPVADLQALGVGGPIARQGFARGLLVDDDCIVGGSSPSTITRYDRATLDVTAQVTLTMDVRHAIHGLLSG